MNRKFLAAVAGWLIIPALTSAQASISPPKLGQPSSPSVLPEPSIQIEPIIPAPQPLPRDVPPAEKPPKKVIEHVLPVPKSAPAAVIAMPQRIESAPAATIGQPCCDPPGKKHRANSVAEAGPTYDYETNFGLATPTLPNSLYWFKPEYLLWSSSGMHVPALVTSSPAGTASAASGVLGDPNTSILFGNQSMANGFRSGLRIAAGAWCDETQTLGLEGTILYLGQARQEQTFTSAGVPGIARPYFNVVQGVQASEPIAFGVVNPGGSINPALVGSLTARVTSDLWGMDFNFRRFLYETDSFRLDGLIGYRYQRLRDAVQTNSNSTVNDFANEPFTLPNNTQIGIMDAFQSTNNFQGGQFGFSGQWQTGRWIFGMNAKLALGVNDRAVGINGQTTFTAPGSTPQTVPGGLLAAPTIIGRYSSSAFSVIPDVGVNIGFQLTPNIRVFAGYSFMYWSNVVRAGDQISTTLNTSQLSRTLPPAGSLSGAALPTFVLHETGYWAQGVNFGMEFRW